MDEDEKEEAEAKPEGEGGEEGKTDMKKEDEEVKKNQQAGARGGAAAGGGAKPDPEMGRLVMTIDGQQKQLPFGPNDLLTTATMLDGDKVRGSRGVTRQLIPHWGASGVTAAHKTDQIKKQDR